MSINTLLENPPSQSKPWCNLYVDTLTAYKDIKSTNLDVNEFTFENGKGEPGQIMRKTPSGIEWANLPGAKIDPGLPGQFLKTDTDTGEVKWENFTLDEVPKGDPQQVLMTNYDGDAVEWSYIPPSSIEPGAANQILTTVGTTPMWSPFLRVESISLRGGSNLDYYKHLPDISTYWKHNGENVAPLTIKMSRIGRVVTVSFTGVGIALEGPEDKLRCDVNLPAEIRPNLPFSQVVPATDWPSLDPVNLIISVGGDGSFIIRDYSETGDWTGKTFLKINLTWHLD